MSEIYRTIEIVPFPFLSSQPLYYDIDQNNELEGFTEYSEWVDNLTHDRSYVESLVNEYVVKVINLSYRIKFSGIDNSQIIFDTDFYIEYRDLSYTFIDTNLIIKGNIVLE